MNVQPNTIAEASTKHNIHRFWQRTLCVTRLVAFRFVANLVEGIAVSVRMFSINVPS